MLKMQSRLTQITITICTLVFLSGCIAVDRTDVNAAGDAPGEPLNTNIDLEGTSWDLSTFNKSRLIEGTRFSLSFEADQVTGNAGCNHYFGDYEFQGNQIGFSAMGMTEMACMEPVGLMEQELVLIELLSNIERFKLVEGRLHLYHRDGEALIFEGVID